MDDEENVWAIADRNKKKYSEAKQNFIGPQQKFHCWYCKQWADELTENDACVRCNREYYTGPHYWM